MIFFLEVMFHLFLKFYKIIQNKKKRFKIIYHKGFFIQKKEYINVYIRASLKTLFTDPHLPNQYIESITSGAFYFYIRVCDSE